jgi:ABC-type polysaccharide/polyol phosphate transport system ATPase subunit
VNAIEVNNLGKKFKLFTSPGGRFLEYMSIGKVKRHADFWALKDISFNIPSGTTLGILGQNGSGKSTLLSILAGVLYPSEGSFEIKGKVSAILELGSGFHPEFSGRDNVYMYGSIMGLSKQQIDDRFDEIVQFSELGDFIDQPLRTYSSGMIVRLAFSVAVHVDADILIVDEALAVGDAIFQHRCFRKIREMQADGKTILYVGHDTEAVRNLCTSALLLDGGRVIERGDPNYVVNKYYALITDRERAYTEENLIEHGDTPRGGYETVYNFVQNLSAAKIVCPPAIPVHEQTINVNSTPRKVIFAHAPSEIMYSVNIEPGSSLAFAIGIMPGAWDKIPQGVKFDIEILCNGRTENIFSRVLQPKRNVGDRGWHNFIVPLEKFSGKTVSVIFDTTGSGDDLSFGWSAWGWGIIIKYHDQKKNLDEEIDEIFGKNTSGQENKRDNEIRFGNRKAEIVLIELFDVNGNSRRSYKNGEWALVKIHVLLHEDFKENLVAGCVIKNKFFDIFGTNTKWEEINFGERKRGDTIIITFLQKLTINRGTYSVNVGIVLFKSDDDIEVLDRRYDCIFFNVTEDKNYSGIINLEHHVQFDVNTRQNT